MCKALKKAITEAPYIINWCELPVVNCRLFITTITSQKRSPLLPD